MSGVTSQRCTICAVCWPPKWAKCPQCGGATSPFSETAPDVTEEEAQSIDNHRQFDEYLEQEKKL